MPVLIFGLFGLAIGSFVNVLVLRHGARALSGRSACMSCGAKLRWFDLIPVVSWLALRGRCRACGSRISAQYPAVELTTGAAFALIAGAQLAIIPTILALINLPILIAISVYDIRHTIIPDAWVWSFNALSFFSVFAFPLQAASYWLPDLLSGPAVALPLFTLWLVSRGTWMGLGDAKLALGIGWLLGPLYGIIALFLAFVIGAVVSVGVLLPLPRIIQFLKKTGIAHTASSKSYTIGSAGASYVRRSQGYENAEALSFHSPRWTMKSEIPFGPFLVIACVFLWFSQMYGIPIPFLWQ